MNKIEGKKKKPAPMHASPVDRLVTQRKFQLKCVATGEQITVLATSFDEAGDLFVDNGWIYDRFLGGYVCLKARVE